MDTLNMISFELAAFSRFQERNAVNALQLSGQSQGKGDTILLQFYYCGVEFFRYERTKN